MLEIKKPRGTNDFFYDSSARLEFIESKIKTFCAKVEFYTFCKVTFSFLFTAYI